MVDNRDTSSEVADQGSVADTSTSVAEKTDYMDSKQFNAAMSARERAFEKKMQKQQEEFTKMLERFAPPAKEEPALSRTAELERTVKDLSKNIQDRDARDKDTHLRKITERALRSHGIDPEFSDMALTVLVDGKKAIRYNEDGEIMMTLNGVEYDNLDDGIAAWAITRDAKLFKKATNAAGSGDTNKAGVKDAKSISSGGEIDIKRREKWAEKFNGSNPKSSMTKDTRIAVSELLVQKLRKH